MPLPSLGNWKWTPTRSRKCRCLTWCPVAFSQDSKTWSSAVVWKPGVHGRVYAASYWRKIVPFAKLTAVSLFHQNVLQEINSLFIPKEKPLVWHQQLFSPYKTLVWNQQLCGCLLNSNSTPPLVDFPTHLKKPWPPCTEIGNLSEWIQTEMPRGRKQDNVVEMNGKWGEMRSRGVGELGLSVESCVFFCFSQL